jgi:hypothetical protein
MYGVWRRPDEAADALGQANQRTQLFSPKTSVVVEAGVEDAFQGATTLYADVKAQEVLAAERNGIKITEEDYKNDPELYSEGVSWVEGMTRESALISKQVNDAARYRQQLFADASTRQAALGIAAGFGAGIVEPKNLAVGVAVSAAAPVLGTAGFLGNTMRRAYQLRKTATLGQRVAIGAGEGVVAGVLVEPSGRYSAKILQQDYTMMDSLFNVATSTALGGLLPVAGAGVGKAKTFLDAKVEKFRGRAGDVIAHEIDLATQQLEAGQRVDVSAVEAAEIGKIADAPIAKQLEAIRAISPERLPQPKTFDIPQPPTKEIMDSRARVEPVPMDRIESSQGVREWDKFNKGEFAAPLIDGYADKPVLAKYKNGDYILFDGNHRTELARSSGASSIEAYVVDVADYAPARDRKQPKQESMSDDQLLRELGVAVEEFDTANAKTLAKSQADALDPKNDTLIDYSAIDAADERRAIMGVENEADAEAYFQDAEAEIKQMLEQDILNEADLDEYRAALEELNSRAPIDALETLKLCFTRG